MEGGRKEEQEGKRGRTSIEVGEAVRERREEGKEGGKGVMKRKGGRGTR